MAERTALVTGGRGFLGRHVVAKLLEAGTWHVKIVDIAPELILDDDEKSGALGRAITSKSAEYIPADVRSNAQLIRVFQGVNVVFHMAATNLSGIDDQKLQHDVNVTGTKNVIDACLKNNVKKLIYTSSASVVFDGVHGIVNGDETLPYPLKAADMYSSTKAEAEALVMMANGRNGLLTCSLRPSGIFGPGDPLLLPKIATVARQGKLKFILGNGENKFDFTYVENVAHAHLLAEAVLAPGSDAAGEAFFITNGEPRPFWDFMFSLLVPLGYTKPSMKLPVQILLPLAQLNEALSQRMKYSTEFLPSRIRNATVWRTFNCSKAAKILGYAPPVPLEEGIRRTVVAAAPKWQNTVSVRAPAGRSKAHLALGGGRVADVLLWRDLKMSAAFLVVGILFYYVVLGGRYKLLQLLAFMALYTVIGLFAYSQMRRVLSMFKVSLPEVPLAEIPEAPVSAMATNTCNAWNSHAIPFLKSVVAGKDYFLIAQVLLALYVVSWIGTLPLRNLVLVSLFLAFAIPILYELNEEKVDSVAAKASQQASVYKNVAAGKLSQVHGATLGRLGSLTSGKSASKPPAVSSSSVTTSGTVTSSQTVQATSAAAAASSAATSLESSTSSAASPPPSAPPMDLLTGFNAAAPAAATGGVDTSSASMDLLTGGADVKMPPAPELNQSTWEIKSTKSSAETVTSESVSSAASSLTTDKLFTQTEEVAPLADAPGQSDEAARDAAARVIQDQARKMLQRKAPSFLDRSPYQLGAAEAAPDLTSEEKTGAERLPADPFAADAVGSHNPFASDLKASDVDTDAAWVEVGSERVDHKLHDDPFEQNTTRGGYY